MKVLVSEKLSEHKYKTPEGYLICTDAILARTGKQSYTKDELFQDGDNTEVNVDRPYDEVMNAKTIASFENKPITFDHPDEDVNIGNYKDYAIGYVRDVRQGKTDKGEDVILGNLVITDQDAINAIEQGDHTDLSCGYDCDIKDDGNGNYSQTNIRGNHLALCEQGRAGIAHIVDSKVEDKLSYEAASSDDNYLDEVEKMIYKFANVRVDTMLVGDKLKISPKASRGFNNKQLNDIASVLMKNVAVSNITISNPDRFDSNVTAKIVDSKMKDSYYDTDDIDRYGNKFRNLSREYSSKLKFRANGRFTHIEGQKNDIKDFLDDYFGPNMGPYSIRDMGWKTPGKRVPAHNEYSNSLKPEEMKSKLEKAAKDNKVDILRGILQELIADVDADLSNTSLDKDETIKHYNKYYAALRKANAGNMQGDVDSCLRELKRSGIHDSKETTMSDAIKMLNIVDAYKKVKDASTDKWVIKNTGLAYEVWNGGKLIKKFATKKQAIEWIHSRFPTDEITEDSTKDGKIWSTLTRKAKHR